ncbi:bacterial regulatory s, luxR family protein [Parabacteroides distasonis str. 3776 D15 iv]|uniref:Bacterial regulatory s, luxR family protein n=1 Tax=Parabacteroides distasonis str. 3776 D15 i TaxID=1339342 RepID=A0AB34L8E4_PARDI|nr:LuxR C-terminal-related transcriptional regulator [Parabacteroides distasonis]KDS37834.1 bacterial regulatory s, luxR family protein [Parabacteroides distasonis str. 3776 D15 i]KDS42778.1 bacterial regulatory s, luxR family protein [Parabacteroides distasonis str. 3776 Po2 i]KDS72990.1 bacterial regulatory s, luxR family protein [Parabacteroides distasonis str. 3776 D15 iv]UVR27213.1 LuxR C-terminal-related transcriptional regulator [Parabacteroides distasonis]
MNAEKKQKIWEAHKRHIELLAKVNNSYVFVVEQHVRYLYLSDSYIRFFGYHPDTLEFQNKEETYFESRIHPEDLIALSNTQERLFEYLQAIQANKILEYKLVYEFRVLNSYNKYVRIISQHQVLELDENGDPWLVMGIADLSPNTAPLDSIKIQVVNFITGETLPLNKFEEKELIEFTPREKEILLLIKSGMLSKEISDRLSVSIHTVNKHRQNIMQKMNADNIIEAIEYARKLGLLD